MTHIVQNIWHAMIAAGWQQQIATLLGLLGVWLATRQSLWNFPVGLVQVALAAVVFLQQKLYADTSLQAVYFVALIYGWICWLRPGKDSSWLAVTRLPLRRVVAIGVFGCLATAALAQILVQVDDPMPWRDAFIGCFGVISQWLEATKRLEAWAGWMLVNSAGLVVYVTIGLYWFVFLYALYLLLSVSGFLAWLRSMHTSVHAASHA